MIICIEGPNGVGKTSLLNHLSARYGHPIFKEAEEPEFIEARQRCKETTVDERAALCLAARKRIYERMTFPTTLLFDRSYYTTAVLAGENLMERVIHDHLSAGIPTPDKTLVLVAEPTTILQRIAHRDRYTHETNTIDTLTRQLTLYRRIISLCPECKEINANNTIHDVISAAEAALG